MPDDNLDVMRRKAAEILNADDEWLQCFKYGAAYVMSLLAAADFYKSVNCDEEAGDIVGDLKQMGAAGDRATIAHNLMRLGVYWDEAELLEAAQTAANDMPLAQLFDIVRQK